MFAAVLQQSVSDLPPQAAAILGLVATALAAYFGGKRRGKKLLEVEEELREFLRNEGIFPSPVTSSLSEEDVDDMLQDNIEVYDGSAAPIRVRFTDESYFAPEDKSQMDNAKKYNPFEYIPYRPARYDSDDFALGYSTFASFLWGTNTVGAVFDDSNDKTYTVICYGDDTVEFYDPKEDEVLDIEDSEDQQLESGLILF